MVLLVVVGVVTANTRKASGIIGCCGCGDSDHEEG